MSLSLSPNSLYRQTTDCTEGGSLTREHCTHLVQCLPFILKSTNLHFGNALFTSSSPVVGSTKG